MSSGFHSARFKKTKERQIDKRERGEGGRGGEREGEEGGRM
jgi:hypothetical protein